MRCDRCGVPINSSTNISIGQSVGLKYDDKAMFLTLGEMGFDVIQSNIIMATLQKGNFFIGMNSYNISQIIINKFERGIHDKFYIDKSVDFIVMFPQYDINSNQRTQWIKWRFFSSVFDENGPLDEFMTYYDLEQVLHIFGDSSEEPEFECDMDRKFTFIDLNNILQLFGKDDITNYIFKQSLNMEDYVTFRDFKGIMEEFNIERPVDPCASEENEIAPGGYPFVPVPKACGDCYDPSIEIYEEVEYSQFLNWNEWNRMHKILAIDIPRNMFEGIMFQNIFYRNSFPIRILTLSKNI